MWVYWGFSVFFYLTMVLESMLPRKWILVIHRIGTGTQCATYLCVLDYMLYDLSFLHSLVSKRVRFVWDDRQQLVATPPPLIG